MIIGGEGRDGKHLRSISYTYIHSYTYTSLEERGEMASIYDPFHIHTYTHTRTHYGKAKRNGPRVVCTLVGSSGGLRKRGKCTARGGKAKRNGPRVVCTLVGSSGGLRKRGKCTARGYGVALGALGPVTNALEYPTAFIAYLFACSMVYRRV
ncbi:hypothetical protein QE152_g4765 [Popillia japonica]|uniref:Uncharacterized protein n=1 Tax=Popillia japonica TaxID=7064 RepID=A0AAW1MZV7_POPJA